jgi:hypothetical protein
MVAFKKHIVLVLLTGFLLGFTTASFAQKKQKVFIDTLDQALDISHYLNHLHGLLPIVSPITEPAVGFGAAGAGLFFIPKKDDRKGFKMPDMVALAGGYTANGTWFTGAGYVGSWKKDRIRYRGVVGYGDIKLKYYGNGDGFLAKNPIQFSLEGLFLLQQIIFRVGNSHFLLGGKYIFGSTKVDSSGDRVLPVDPRDIKMINSGVGFIAEYENLNNIFSPSRGIRSNLTYNQYLEVLGGDRNFGILSYFFIDYFNVIKNHWNAGCRFESQLSLGDAPFYMRPFVYLRGVPAMRYQGELTALVETEQEILFGRRWSMVAFGGIGHAFKSLDEMEVGTTAWNAGTGFRYLIARALGLKMGLDVARGPEQYAVYVVFGSSWIK